MYAEKDSWDENRLTLEHDLRMAIEKFNAASTGEEQRRASYEMNRLSLLAADFSTPAKTNRP